MCIRDRNQTATQSAPGTSATTADTVQGSATGVPVRVGVGMWWIEANGAAAAASSTTAGTSRSNGSASGGLSPFGYFQVQAYSTTAGTLNIYNDSYSGGIALVATLAVPAGTSGVLKAPAFGTYFHASFVNGTTAGAVNISDGFTAN